MYQHIDLAEQDTYDIFCLIDSLKYYFICCILSFIIMTNRFKVLCEDLKISALSTILDVTDMTRLFRKFQYYF